ncbi:MAG: hypothetical protein Q7S23_04505 [bacterium]|nr:hypothetical protein [bacterium]
MTRRQPIPLRPRGFSVVEGIISIAIAATIVVAIGSLLQRVNATRRASEMRQMADAYAVESIELMTGLKNAAFACRCSVDSCTATSCTRASDHQSCPLLPDFTSCWTEFPAGLAELTPLRLSNTGGSWVLLAGPETIGVDLQFTRTLTIENLRRDVDGNISSTGTVDFNTKKITVTVSWMEGSAPKSLTLSQIVTGWKNL